MPFEGKAIWIWSTEAIEGGSPARIAARLVEAGFEAAYLHSVSLSNWRSAARVALVPVLKAAGLQVYGSAGVYGDQAALEGQQAAAIVEEYGLAGFIFDAEVGWDAKPARVANTTAMLKVYQAGTRKPSAWCYWAFLHDSTGVPWHPVEVLAEAMKYCECAMPMAYWSSATNNSPEFAANYLNSSYKQWQPYLAGKVFCPGGRAFNGSGLPGLMTPQQVGAFDAKARALGAKGITWWSMQHALALPDVWAALAQTPKFAQAEEPIMQNAIGLHTKTADWTNPNFDFIAGFAQQTWEEPNPNLKPIELKAAGEGKPFFLWYEFNVGWYTFQQYMPDEQHWPPVANDVPLQEFIAILRARSYAGVIISVRDINDHQGKPQNPFTVSYAAKIFTGRVGDWLRANRPNAKLIVASSNAFIAARAPDINNWIGQYNSCAVQTAQKPLIDNAYPDPTEKPAYLDNRPTCEFWRYREISGTLALLAFRLGDRAALKTWLGAGPVEPPPPPPGAVTRAEFDALSALVADLRAAQSGQAGKITALEGWQARVQAK